MNGPLLLRWVTLVTRWKARLDCALIIPAGHEIESEAGLCIDHSGRSRDGKRGCPLCSLLHLKIGKKEAVFSSTGLHMMYTLSSELLISRPFFSTETQSYSDPNLTFDFCYPDYVISWMLLRMDHGIIMHFRLCEEKGFFVWLLFSS